MKYFFNIPVLTCTLLFAGAQMSWAQTSGRGTSTQTNTGTSQGSGQGTTDTKQPVDKSVSVGNDSDISGGTTNTGSKNANPKMAKDSRHCAANENFVKQGDHMVCVPRTTSDNGAPMGKEKAQ
jgi:hypothetical protein